MTVIVTGIPRKDSASPFVVLATVFGLPGIRLWLRRGEHGGESVQRLVHLVRRISALSTCRALSGVAGESDRKA